MTAHRLYHDEVPSWVEVCAALLEGAAAGYAFRADEARDVHDVAAAELRSARDEIEVWRHSPLIEVGGVCGTQCVLCAERTRESCAVGQRALLAARGVGRAGVLYTSAISFRRKARRARTIFRNRSTAAEVRNSAEYWLGTWWGMSWGKGKKGYWGLWQGEDGEWTATAPRRLARRIET
jgi:hypothetical protein